MVNDESLGNSHSVMMGYLFWLFGFLGAHRFYYGKPKSGTLYFFTFGLLGIGWLIDIFLIPSMDSEADRRFKEGHLEYNLAWILLTFTGFLGFHRIYMGKIFTGIIYFFTFGLGTIGILYDFWTLNSQVNEINSKDENA